VDFVHALPQQEQPPPMSTKSRPENGRPSVNSGSVSPAIHDSVSSSAMRVPIASSRPMRRARLRCASGSRPTRIEMKMMLSMPSTISSQRTQGDPRLGIGDPAEQGFSGAGKRS
jgi:hypothetical protein